MMIFHVPAIFTFSKVTGAEQELDRVEIKLENKVICWLTSSVDTGKVYLGFAEAISGCEFEYDEIHAAILEAKKLLDKMLEARKLNP